LPQSHHGLTDLGENHSYWLQTVLPIQVLVPVSLSFGGRDRAWLASSPHTTSFNKLSEGWVTVTHPHHPLYGQRVQIIRVRRGPDPDLIIRMPDGYHGAIAASLTDYAGTSEVDPGAAKPSLLSIEGLWKIAQWISQQGQEEPLARRDTI
jgi:hypothetical protein